MAKTKTKKAAPKKSAKAPKKSKATPKPKAKKAAPKPKAAYAKPEPTKRPYRRGQSPFCSPLVGDQVGNSTETRTVTGYSDDGTKIDYTSTLGYTRSVAKPSWAQWCSRTAATLISRTADEPKALAAPEPTEAAASTGSAAESSDSAD